MSKEYRIIYQLEAPGGKKLVEIITNAGLGFERLIRICPNLDEKDKFSVLMFLNKNLRGRYDWEELGEDAEKRGYIRQSGGSDALVFDSII